MIKIDQLIRTKRKSIALIVQRDGRLIVRAPIKAPIKTILAFVEKKAGWIQSKQALVKSVYPQAVEKKYVDGEKFWYLGKLYPLEIVDRANPPLALKDRFLMARPVLPKAQAHFTNWYKEQAKTIISERVQEYAARYCFVYRQIKITSARTRWGSCSSKGTLCFSWRLVMAPLPVIDYVVVHELAHLIEKNHGKAFWAKVNALMPDYKQKIAWLKVNGHVLSI
jgi:predicted metal-dependent hydrolase